MDTGTTAFMLCCIIGLTMMIPGLALFYGGMVSVKSSTNMMMMTFGAVAVVGVLWVLFGFSMAFGTSYGGFVGSFTEFAGMKNLTEPMTTINGLPVSLFALFQALFAAITVALISGAAADRMKFGAWMTFATAWAILVYFPVAHWVFAFDGVVTPDAIGRLDRQQAQGHRLRRRHCGAHQLRRCGTGRRDRAGQVRLASGKFRKPHNVPLTLLGAGLLWAGWYAFNGGSALAAGTSAAIVMVTTFVATCAATLAWLARREVQGRPRHRRRRGVGRGGRTGRHHPCLRRGHPDRRDLRRLDRRRDLPAGGRAEVEVRLRRLARRGRRAPGRRRRSAPC